MKQKTIGLNPLEAYLSKGNEKKETPAEAPDSLILPLEMNKEASVVLTEQKQQEQTPLLGKQRITLHISADVVDRIKNAVYWEPGLTIAGFAEEALEKALVQIEAERGSPFPQRREHRLRGGRPLL